jgi:asparagine synthase (glutamine-hydrolysing)
MCRIAGMLDLSLPTVIIEHRVKLMCTLQKAGGPDGEGLYCDPQHHLVLGHRRLSIIDLSATGHQPMSFAAERYWITYNGELYNYPELRQELLGLGCNFSGTSDTEVVLASFATWGTAAFSRLNGMFAFALWDSFSANLYLVRDAAGIKPLYYSLTKNGLLFASEVKAFANNPLLQQENPNWKVYMMAYGHLPEPITTLQGVQPLQKGTWLKYDAASGKCFQRAYSQYSYLEIISDRKEAIHSIQDCLAKAVKRHLLADAPIGVFLSGGLDSSIIALLAQKDQDELKTISLDLEQDQFSEKKFQHSLQQQMNCKHFQHLLKEEEFHHYLPAIIDTMDLPSSDGINTWFISKYARESGLKAVLSGLGGDELYGGYPSFKRVQSALFFKQFPNSILRAGKFSAIKKFRRLVYLSIEGPIGRYLFLRGQFTPNEIAIQLGAYEHEVWQLLSESPVLSDIDQLTPQNQASWMETNLYMQNQLLRDADVMSMAHGLEIRMPFLDADFTRLSLQISSSVKYGGTLGKQLLIDSFKDILPEMIWNRPKMGFTFPFKEWLISSDYARDLLGNDTHGNYKKFKSGEIHWSQYLSSTLIAQHQYA